MNLLTVLLLSLLSGKSLGALSNNTGVNQLDLKKLLILALPLIIKYMTNNSQSQSGLSSLFGALGAHQNRGSVESQIADADVEDGQKIIGHILGNNEKKVEQRMSKGKAIQEIRWGIRKHHLRQPCRPRRRSRRPVLPKCLLR